MAKSKYCIECGAALPQEAKFCSACGKPQPAAEEKPAVETVQPQWENCEIICADLGEHWGIFPKDRLQFQAVTTDGGEAKTIGTSPEFMAGTTDYGVPREKSKRHQNVLNQFITELIKKGWQPLPARGGEWYSYRFRRERMEK